VEKFRNTSSDEVKSLSHEVKQRGDARCATDKTRMVFECGGFREMGKYF